MDKNKNRTDLLAAGRKKLQQYRQKKDGKGSKSSGKANKSDPDAVTDESSSVAKPTKGKKQLPVAETRVQDSATELADSSNADVATPDLSPTSDLPIAETPVQDSATELADSSNADVATPDLSPTSYLPIAETPVQDSATELADSSNADVATPDLSRTSDLPIAETPVQNSATELADSSNADVATPDLSPTSDVPIAETPVQDSATELADSLNADVATPDLSPTSDVPIAETPVQDSTTELADSSNAGVATPDLSSTSDLPIAESPVQDSATELAADVATPDTSSTLDLPIAETLVQYSATELADSSNADVATPDVSSTLDSPIAETPIQDSATELADSSNADVATPDLSSTSDLPIAETRVQDSATELTKSSNADVATPDLSSTSDLPIEASEADMAVNDSVPDTIQTVSSPKTVDIEETPESSYVVVTPVDELTQKAGEFKAASGEDQVPDVGSMQEHNHSISEPDNTTSLINLEEDNKTESAISVTEQTNELDDSGANNEPIFQPKEDVMAVFHGDSEVNPVHLTQLAKTFQNLNEDEFRFVMSARDSVNGGDLNNDGFQFCERLKEQLYVNNFEKELIYLQFCEESVAQKEFDQHRLQWFNEKSSFSAYIGEIEGKNKILSEEVEICRSEIENIQMDFSFAKRELDRSSVHIQELQIELEKSENQLANVSTELVDSRSLLSDLQMKNENLSLNVSSLNDEKQKLEKEKEDGILENEKLKKELIELKSVMESLQVENINFKENYVSEKENLLTELVELKRSNEQFVEENKEISMKLLESQQLVESLQSENANFEKERTELGEKITGLTVNNEESLTELTNCRSLMNDLQMEYEKSMIDLLNGAHRLEQLTEENVTLNSTLDTYKAKIQEFDDLKLKFEQKTVQENSHHLTGGSLEETFIENIVLDEVMKQYVSIVEAKKGELFDFCEELKQESIITNTKNSQLTDKISSFESKIDDLQTQVDELQQLETIYKKLEDASSIGSSETDFGQTVTTRVTTSVDQTLAMIQNLQENLENALKNNTLLSDSCQELTEKIKDLETTNELSSHVINKVFNNLQEIVNDSGPPTQESEEVTKTEQLDQLEISNYDVFIDKLIMMLRERTQLESKNREYNLELIKDLEEINKRCINPDFILKLFEDIQSSVTLHNIEIKPDELESSLESVIHFLMKNLKFNEMKSIELQNEIDKLTFSLFPYEIETLIFKESLVTAMEQIVRVQSEIQLKETEFHQSEQRFLSVREKLHIAVTKGKGLIQQRDNLKQNLTATENELEKCLHELQLKDATIQETETKLRNYSEAGERMEALESELSYIRNSATALRESFLLKDSVLQRIEEVLEDLDLPEDFHARDIIDKIDYLAKSVSVINSNQTSSIPIERTRSYPESGSWALDNWRENVEIVEPTSNQDDELRRNYEDLQNKFYGLAEHNEMLEQSLMERNNLVQRFEEVLDRINMPQQLRSLEPEDRIEWLRVALLETNDRCTLLQQDINDLEKVRESLAGDLEESQKRLADLESTLKSTTDEREQLSASLEVKSRDYDKICEKAALYESEIDKLQNEKVHESVTADLEESQRRLVDLESTLKSISNEREQLFTSLEVKTRDYERICEKTALYETEIDKLQIEVGGLQLKLDENRVNEEHLHHIHGEIGRLQKLVKDMLQDSETGDFDSNVADIQCLEGLLRKLADKHITELTHAERSVDQSNMLGELERKLEEVEGELVQVKDERDIHVEKSQTLVNEIKALQVKNQELQNLLIQEEQKMATVNKKSQSLVNEIEELQVKNQELQNLLVQEEQKTDAVNKKSQPLVNEFEAIQVKNQELQNLLVQEEQKSAAVIQKSQSLVNEIEALQVKIQELQNLLVHEEQKTDAVNKKSQSLVNEIEALQVKNQELQNLLVQEEQKTAAVNQKSQSLVNEIEELQVKNQELQNLLVQEEQKTDAVNKKSQPLVNEIEALQVKNQELQNLLVQEEQKTATVKEKLNVAVRKGKSLVQVRDSMKQTINDLTSQVDRLTSENKHHENTILEFQEKMKDLITSQEMVENKDSEIRFLKNRLEESNNELQDKTNTLTMILTALGDIDLGFDLKTNDPFQKMKQIEKVLQDLQDAISSAEQDSRKSKKAAELLLAEVNEIQERNEDLLEELSRITMEKDSAEAAKIESLKRIEQISNLHLEEKSSQFSQLMNLKSGLDQLKPGLRKIYNLINDGFPKDLELLYNLEASDARSASKVNVHSDLFLDTKTEELHDDTKISDLWRFIGSHMQNLVTNINRFEEKLQTNLETLHEKVILLSETVNSHKSSIESAKEEISWLESNNKQKETENKMQNIYISVLYEACKNSVSEIEKNKGELVENDFSGEDIFSEERITNMVNRLLSAVKDFNINHAENMEVNLKEMKSTISNLQKELTEKDVQKDRICVDLVNQIKRAEATAMSHLQELEPAKAQINDLKEQCKLLEQKVKELESQETVLVVLNEKVKSLTDALTAKEQENEGLLQALDEEEAQMEDLTNKITKLEKIVQQKDLDLEAAESARAKSLKKLSTTVNKFDELHHLSETLVSEVDQLQSQLQERDSEISFLRSEITRCTSDSLQALETDKKSLDEFQDIISWLDSTVSGVETNNMHEHEQVHEYKEIIKKQITSIISELKDLKQLAQNKGDLLNIERSKVDDLMRSLRDKESRLSLHENENDSVQGTSMTSEIVEVEPVIKKWPSQGTSRAPQVRSLRKVNNDQLAISIDDVDSNDKDKLEDDDDDDKAHGFKSLTTSKLVPRFTRPVTDFVDGLWVSCDRTLMRQPVLRLSLIFYWAVIHALLAVFVV